LEVAKCRVLQALHSGYLVTAPLQGPASKVAAHLL